MILLWPVAADDQLDVSCITQYDSDTVFIAYDSEFLHFVYSYDVNFIRCKYYVWHYNNDHCIFWQLFPLQK